MRRAASLNTFSFEGTVNWFPGHMGKALKQVQQRLAGADVVIEVRDARVPLSSSNAAFEELLQTKKRLIVLNKVDLTCKTEIQAVDASLSRMEPSQVGVLQTSVAQQQWNIHKIVPTALALASDIRPRFKKEPLRVVILGLPNVGKSSIINAIKSKRANSKGGRAKTGGNPGTTRGQSSFQVWDKPVTVLVDTPGIMMPRIANNTDGLKLALLGIVKDGIVSPMLVASYMLHVLNTFEAHRYVDIFGLDEQTSDLELVLQKVKAKTGAQSDTAAIKLMLSRFRKGELGGFVLDDVVDAVAP